MLVKKVEEKSGHDNMCCVEKIVVFIPVDCCKGDRIIRIERA